MATMTLTQQTRNEITMEPGPEAIIELHLPEHMLLARTALSIVEAAYIATNAPQEVIDGDVLAFTIQDRIWHEVLTGGAVERALAVGDRVSVTGLGTWRVERDGWHLMQEVM